MAYQAYGDAGASQFGAGGFMPSPAPGHDNGYGGAGAGQQKGRNQHNSLRAFTIRHLLKETASSDDDHFMADGREISTVTIVGRVTSYQEQATRVLLQVHDGTGSMEVCSWVDDMDVQIRVLNAPLLTQAQKRVEWQQGKYVRVYGNIKSFERKRSITAFAIKPVLDHNEVTYHFLQSIMQHLHLTKGAPPTGQQSGGGAAGHLGSRTPMGAASYGGAPATGGFGGMQHGGYGGGAPQATGGSEEQDIMAIFNQPQALNAPNGLSAEQVLQELRSQGRTHFTMQRVIQICEHQAAEGHLYSTINDTTWKATGA